MKSKWPSVAHCALTVGAELLDLLVDLADARRVVLDGLHALGRQRREHDVGRHRRPPRWVSRSVLPIRPSRMRCSCPTHAPASVARRRRSSPRSPPRRPRAAPTLDAAQAVLRRRPARTDAARDRSRSTAPASRRSRRSTSASTACPSSSAPTGADRRRSTGTVPAPFQRAGRASAPFTLAADRAATTRPTRVATSRRSRALAVEQSAARAPPPRARALPRPRVHRARRAGLRALRVRAARSQKTVRLARLPTAPCGTFSVKRRQIPVEDARAGRWTIQFDQEQRLRRRRPGAASGCTITRPRARRQA